jgi:hypothetical protein
MNLMLGNILRGFLLVAACASAHAAERNELLPISIGGYGHYVLLPVTASEFKPHRGLLPSISDRLLGRMAPILNEWNYQEKSANVNTELAMALVIDKSKGVSGGARLMWGPLAGSSDIIAHVDLIERPSGKLLGRQVFFTAKNSSWSPAGGVSDYLMYDDLVNQVVLYLSSCYSVQHGERNK